MIDNSHIYYEKLDFEVLLVIINIILNNKFYNEKISDRVRKKEVPLRKTFERRRKISKKTSITFELAQDKNISSRIQKNKVSILHLIHM